MQLTRFGPIWSLKPGITTEHSGCEPKGQKNTPTRKWGRGKEGRAPRVPTAPLQFWQARLSPALAWPHGGGVGGVFAGKNRSQRTTTTRPFPTSERRRRALAPERARMPQGTKVGGQPGPPGKRRVRLARAPLAAPAPRGGAPRAGTWAEAQRDQATVPEALSQRSGSPGLGAPLLA